MPGHLARRPRCALLPDLPGADSIPHAVADLVVQAQGAVEHPVGEAGGDAGLGRLDLALGVRAGLQHRAGQRVLHGPLSW
jgi:hypothetical protein